MFSSPILQMKQHILEWVDIILDPASTVRSLIDFIGAVIAVAGGVVVVVKLINRVCKKIFGPRREYNQFVDRVYTKDARKSISKYYIPTRAQDVDPCEQEEIRDNNGKFLSDPLIPFFCNHAFIESSRGKYYLVLADSGMGKTTFLLRLYKECLLGHKRKNKKKIQYVPLAYQNALQSINALPDKTNTILLLDALDENMDAINDYETFFDKLLNYTEEFNKIVITCRTQFFPNRAMEPAVTGRIQTVHGRKREEIVKKYLSPFSDEEVKLYLKKRYKYRRSMQRKAFRIVKQVPTLMARPIILNWIDFLCVPASRYKYSFQIYDVIIEKWIEREELGDGGRKLFDLSYKIAEYMFKNETTSVPAKVVDEISTAKEINLEPIIARSRSLLNRNGAGEYKFAHRSFLEYFIVFGIFANMRMPAKTEFLFSLSGAKLFLFEMLLQSAELTYNIELNQAVQKIVEIKQYTGVDNVISYIQNPKVRFFRRNRIDGFDIEARLIIRDSDSYDPNSVLSINDSMFVECDASKRIVLHEESPRQATLVFEVFKGDTHPATKVSFKFDK